jgi:hypothetical protein
MAWSQFSFLIEKLNSYGSEAMTYTGLKVDRVALGVTENGAHYFRWYQVFTAKRIARDDSTSYFFTISYRLSIPYLKFMRLELFQILDFFGFWNIFIIFMIWVSPNPKIWML